MSNIRILFVFEEGVQTLSVQRQVFHTEISHEMELFAKVPFHDLGADYYVDDIIIARGVPMNPGTTVTFQCTLGRQEVCLPGCVAKSGESCGLA